MVSRSERGQAVIDHRYLTDCFFKQHLDDFISHWLHVVLHANWHWFRFEYQSKGSTHAHGCAKLKKDPYIPTLRACAAKAWSLLETQSDMENFEFRFQSAADEAGGLDAVVFLSKNAEVVFLSKNAEVMLTSNIWAEVGLCDGSFGVVEQFLVCGGCRNS